MCLWNEPLAARITNYIGHTWSTHERAWDGLVFVQTKHGAGHINGILTTGPIEANIGPAEQKLGCRT